MNTNRFARVLPSCALLLLLLCTAAAAGATAAPAAKPNVVFIICDDLGYADVGAYGQQKIKTPHLDRLAAVGMRFTQHYSGSPVCGPSRSCLLTGQHTGHTPVRANPRYAKDWPRANGDPPLPAGIPSLGKLFKDAGYATGVIGKWGLGRPGTSGGPERQGFDHFFGYADHIPAHEYYPDSLWRNGEQVPLNGKQYSHDLFAADALQFVRTNKDKPFFLYLAFTIPHTKLQVPSVEPYANESWSEPRKKMAAMISRMDADVGRLLALLKELGIDDKTLVVFTSDNGPWPVKGIGEFFDSNGPLRGHKRDVYEGGIRVPFIARWPGKIDAGKTSEHVCANWDVLPTFAELLGAPAPQGTDGISILPTLLGRPGEQKAHEYLYWEFNELGGQQALRTGDWKGVRLKLAENPNAPMQLYNLKDDPGESKDVAAENPEVVKKIDSLMTAAYIPNPRYPRWSPAKKGKDDDGE